MALRPSPLSLSPKNPLISSRISSKPSTSSPSNHISQTKNLNKRPIIVHVKLIELLDQSPSNLSESFSQRLKRRLTLPKYKKSSEFALENEKFSGKQENNYEHLSKMTNKSARQKNLEELLSIRRCHLLYS